MSLTGSGVRHTTNGMHMLEATTALVRTIGVVSTIVARIETFPFFVVT
jgi:hypothetical protein